MDSRICTYVDTIELDREIQKIIHAVDERGYFKYKITSIVRTSNICPKNLSDKECADYIILYTSIKK
jgi:hypothetical protein